MRVNEIQQKPRSAWAKTRLDSREKLKARWWHSCAKWIQISEGRAPVQLTADKMVHKVGFKNIVAYMRIFSDSLTYSEILL